MALTTIIDYINSVWNGTGGGSNKLNVDASGSSVTATVSGSVNQGTPTSVGSAWPVKLTDGVDTATVNSDGSINVANVVSVVASTATISNLASSASTQVVLAANAGRKGFLLFNDSTQTCYVAFASTASTSMFTMKLIAGMTYQNEAIMYTGIISAIWDSANGALRITELS